MFKGIYSEVAKEVGKSSAILLNQLLQWKTVKVFRTNAEMFEDLDGVLSVATIQRCKQKLIDFGYVIVSFDKGLNRVTHYTLTEKALSLLTKTLSLLTDKRVKQGVHKEQTIVPTVAKQLEVSSKLAEVSTKQDASAFYCLNESEPLNTSEPIENNTVEITESVTVEHKEESGTYVAHEDISRFYDVTGSDNKAHDNTYKKPSTWNTSEKFLPPHLYAQKMKQERILEQQNKEFFIPKSMRDSFETAGEVRRGVVKGVPKDLLSDPRLANMLKSKQTKTKFY